MRGDDDDDDDNDGDDDEEEEDDDDDDGDGDQDACDDVGNSTGGVGDGGYSGEDTINDGQTAVLTTSATLHALAD